MWKCQFLVNLLAGVLGGFQYGYHLSELNASQDAISCKMTAPGNSWFEDHGYAQCIEMDSQFFGLATSLYAIGGFIGSWSCSHISDKYGRKNCNLFNSLVFLLGCLIECFANSIRQLCFGRFVCGFAAGCTMVNTPLIMNEIADDQQRGLLGTINQLVANCGVLFTQGLALTFATPHRWRYVFVAGAAVAGLNFVVGIFAIETPKWLLKNQQPILALTNLKSLRQCYDPEFEIHKWSVEIGEAQHYASLWTYLRSPKYNLSKMVVTIILAAQQLTGIPAVIQYGVLVIQAVTPGFSIAINCIISAFNIVFTAVASILIEKVGRKTLLMTSNCGMFASTILITVGLVRHMRYLAIVMVFLFVSFFAIGMGPIPFLISAEVTQLEATTAAQSYGTSLNWIVTVAISYAFPAVNNAIGGYVFLIFAGFLAITIVLIGLLFPETRGKTTYTEVWNLQDDDDDSTLNFQSPEI